METDTLHRMQGMTTFAQNLREAREAADLTQEQLANLLGVKRTNYVPYENGKKPSDGFIERLAAVKELGVSYKKLKAWKIMDTLSSDERKALKEELKRIK